MREVFPQIERLLEEEPATTEIGRVREALALQLACKLDEAVADTSTGSAQATPGISKELRAVLGDIVASRGGKQEFLAAVFNEDAEE